MANLKNIRSQIKSVTSIQKVTKAMKMVAAAKLRKSQENMEKARPYSERLKNLIADLIHNVDRSLMPLLEKHSDNNKIGHIHKKNKSATLQGVKIKINNIGQRGQEIDLKKTKI